MCALSLQLSGQTTDAVHVCTCSLQVAGTQAHHSLSSCIHSHTLLMPFPHIPIADGNVPCPSHKVMRLLASMCVIPTTFPLDSHSLYSRFMRHSRNDQIFYGNGIPTRSQFVHILITKLSHNVWDGNRLRKVWVRETAIIIY
jgi:hypothetical protein